MMTTTTTLPATTTMCFFVRADVTMVHAMSTFLTLKDICRFNEAVESAAGSLTSSSSSSSSSSLSSVRHEDVVAVVDPISGVAVESEKVSFPSFLVAHAHEYTPTYHPRCPTSIQSAQVPFQEMMRRNGEVGIYDHLQKMKRFFKWIMKYRIRLSSVCFDGYCDSYMSIVFSQFLCKDNNPTTASLESLSIRMCSDRFGSRYTDLMEVIAAKCTNLRELDTCSADIRLACFLHMVKHMQSLERVMLRGAGRSGSGSGPGAGVGALARDVDDDSVIDFWSNLVQFISPRLEVFIVERSFRCAATIDKSTFVTALKSRCPNLQRIQIDFAACRRMGHPKPQDAVFQYSWSHQE